MKNNLSFHQGGASVELGHQSPDKLEWIFPIPSWKASGSGLTKRGMQGEQSRRAALGLRSVWLVPCTPRACTAHSQQPQHNPCRFAPAGSVHPGQAQAWLCGQEHQLSSSSPEWSATDVVRGRQGFTWSSRLPDCSLVHYWNLVWPTPLTSDPVPLVEYTDFTGCLTDLQV